MRFFAFHKFYIISDGCLHQNIYKSIYIIIIYNRAILFLLSDNCYKNKLDNNGDKDQR